ncbi:low-density lipoprotein receptor-related protein [Elysia marginata]|uniref:Low-density lipoprotein receptor-related protein n=1 Tax=Elysia marginata TaxID=1093978 RepID=A0AAV4IA68_9GAST|nr:low-density lipoprotein receptor-related protein [Elysia marginata]
MEAAKLLLTANNLSSLNQILCGENEGDDRSSVRSFSSKRKVKSPSDKTNSSQRAYSLYSVISRPLQTGKAISRLVSSTLNVGSFLEHYGIKTGSSHAPRPSDWEASSVQARHPTEKADMKAVMNSEGFLAHSQLMSSRVVQALMSYNVPINRLLEEVQNDCETGTGNYQAAEIITDYLFGDSKQVEVGYLEWIRFLGTRIDKKTVFPRMELLKEAINRLKNAGLGNIPVADAMTLFWDGATIERSGLFYSLLTSLADCQGPFADSKRLADSVNDHGYKADQSDDDVANSHDEETDQSSSARQHSACSSASTLFTTSVVFHSFTSGAADTAESTDTPHPSDNSTSSTDRCAEHDFQCAETHVCIPRAKLCNHHNDCGVGDTSDESPAACKSYCEGSGGFHCPETTQCISQNLTCNHDFDCWNGEDERRPPCPCLPGLYLCPDGSHCIEHSKDCDGNEDCDDGSDERLELCQKKLNVDVNGWLISHPKYLDKLHKVCCLAGEELSGEKILKRFGLRYYNCSEDTGGYSCRDKCRNVDSAPHSVIQCDDVNSNVKCISKTYLCDGDNDCGNDRDEYDPLCRLKCSDKKVSCGDGSCIESSQLCNDKPDCKNQRDEDPYTCVREWYRLDTQKKCQFHPENEKSQCESALKETCCDAVKKHVAGLNATTENSLLPPNTTAFPGGTSVVPMHSTTLEPNGTFPFPLANSSQNVTGLPSSSDQTGGAAVTIGFVPAMLMGAGITGVVFLVCGAVGAVAFYRYKRYGYVVRPGMSDRHVVEDSRQPLTPEMEMVEQERHQGAVNEAAEMEELELNV